MRRALPALVLGMVTLWGSPARAVSDAQVWVPIQARIKLNDRFRSGSKGSSAWAATACARRSSARRSATTRSRTGASTSDTVGSRASTTSGTRTGIYQESLFDNYVGNLRIMNRSRLEERSIEDVEGVSMRVRHQLRMMYPLERSKHWFIAVQDEPFVTLNDRLPGGLVGGFDQNRAYVGIRYQFTKAVALELGYMNQYINKPPGEENVSSNNVLVACSTFSL